MRRSLTLRRAERRGRLDELPSRAPEDALLKGVRTPLERVLERLAHVSPRIGRTWRTLLRRLKPSRDDYDTLAAMDLAACYQQLGAGDEAYRVVVEAHARTLLRSGVPEDHAIAAVALYLEACLPHLQERAEFGALVRLTSATQRLVAAGYGEERSAGLHRLDDRERQKLSSDLHDEVGADLIVLKMYVESIALELANDCATPIGPKLGEALVLISHAIESVRRLTLDLGPAFLEALGFRPALRSFVRQFSMRTGIKVELEEEDVSVRLPASHETALYRVLRGALSNVAKHSKARRVTVTLRCSGDVLLMVIQDDGKGFELRRQNPEQSFGLTAMRERIRDLRGRIHIESRVARRRGDRSGTRIEVRLPLRKRAAA